MIRLLIITIIFLTASCNKNKDANGQLPLTDSSKTESKQEIYQIKTKSSLQYDQFRNTTWISEIIEGVYDSLTFTSLEDVRYYSAEMNYFYSSKYRIDNDTLKIDIYDFKSHVDLDAGQEVISKYYLILNDSNLHFAKILHGSRDYFMEVDKEIYNNVNEFSLAK